MMRERGTRQRALQGLQLFEQMMAVAVTLARILLQQPQHDALGSRTAILADTGRARRGRRALHLQQAVAIACAERQLHRVGDPKRQIGQMLSCVLDLLR